MKYLKTIGKVLAAVVEPLHRNCAFAVFMYMLGCITAWATLPTHAEHTSTTTSTSNCSSTCTCSR